MDGEESGLIGIFGSGRSGTTLLMRLLDGSPGLWVYPIELNYFSIAPGRRVPDGSLFRGWARKQMAELKTTYLDQLSEPASPAGNPAEKLAEGTDWTDEKRLSNFLSAVRNAYDGRKPERAPKSVFKSIEVGRLPFYAALFPTMRFIHIVRDPLTNYASLKRTDMVTKKKPFWFQGGDILRLHLEGRWIPTPGSFSEPWRASRTAISS